LPLHQHVPIDAATGRMLSARRVYAGVVEHSMYVDRAARRGGIGSALLAVRPSAQLDRCGCGGFHAGRRREPDEPTAG
jgi:GNAT superfamily N-acetyltransferase